MNTEQTRKCIFLRESGSIYFFDRHQFAMPLSHQAWNLMSRGQSQLVFPFASYPCGAS